MSKEAQAIDVETIEIPLSERGLTDLAAMLVKSGRMSSASFREWAHRTQQFAGRWSNDSKSGASKKGKAKGGKTSDKPPQKSKKQTAKETKDKEKLRVLKILMPECTLGNWGEVTNLSAGKAKVLQEDLLLMFETFSDNEDGVKGALLGKGLSEDDIKLSRSFLPYLPRYQKPENRADLVGAGVASDDQKRAAVPRSNESSLKTALAKGKGNAIPIEDLVDPPGGADKATLSEHFGRYDWTSSPNNPAKGLAKMLKPAAGVVGTTTSKWKSLSLVAKFATLAKHYGQEEN